MIEYYKNCFENLIKSEIDLYNDKIYQLMEKYQNSMKEYVKNNEKTILEKIKSIIFTTDNDYQYLLTSYENILIYLKDETKEIIKSIDNLNMNLFTSLNTVLKNHGISSKNYDQIISELKIKLDLENSLKNLYSKRIKEFKQIGISLGISSTLGIATTGFVFGLNSFCNFIGTQIITGSLVGPVGTVAGATVGTITFLGQTI